MSGSYSAPQTWATNDVAGATDLNVYTTDVRFLAESGSDGRPLCYAYRAGGQSVANVTATAVNFDQHSDNGTHSTTVNPSRFTAPIAGLYRLTTGIRYGADIDGTRHILIIPNGSGVSFAGVVQITHGIFDVEQNAIAVRRLAAGEYLEVYAYHTAGNNIDVVAGSWALFEWIAN